MNGGEMVSLSITLKGHLYWNPDERGSLTVHLKKMDEP